MFGRYAAEVQDDCAEAARLQKEVGHAQSLVDPFYPVDPRQRPEDQAAAHPEKPRKVYAGRRSGFGMQSVRSVDPRADLLFARDPGKEGERKRSSAGTFRARYLNDRAQGEAAGQQLIDAGDACRDHVPDGPRHWRQGARDAVGQSGFDLDT